MTNIISNRSFDFSFSILLHLSSLVAQSKESACLCRRHRNTDSIPVSGRSPGGGNSNPIQCSWMENPMDTGAWQTTVHGVAKSWT